MKKFAGNLGQLFQSILLLYLTLSSTGHTVLGAVESGGRMHYTGIFNTFVWLNVFNKFNCRKINDEINIFEGLGDSHMSHYIILIIIIGQILMVNYGGDWCQTTPLSRNQWLTNIGIGRLSIPVGTCLRLINRKDDATISIGGAKVVDGRKKDF